MHAYEPMPSALERCAECVSAVITLQDSVLERAGLTTRQLAAHTADQLFASRVVNVNDQARTGNERDTSASPRLLLAQHV